MSAGPIRPRQLWDLPMTSTSTTAECTPFALPSDGVISFGPDDLVTLTANVVFQPACTGGYVYPDSSDPSSVADLQDPFYGSTIPQTYVVACCTVIAWVLVIMLTINPRSFYMGGGSNFASGKGLIGGATGVGSAPGVGSRPWLQKVATLAVAVSMTIATADTFKVAERQYWNGYMDANAMRAQVEGSLEIRIVRVVSDIFLWLAQVQTLIRLFPRHKEKVIIKWLGFALIVLDTTFSCLNSFMIDNVSRPRNFVDAIPALSYLFELAVGLLYAAWVMFYGLTKRRYAYYHRRMKNICVVALLSHVAILTPVVFFVTDVSQPDVAAWGDYFRWVGAGAASVVVWEWVERIEMLERDEKKDGILGREIFDGDEMLDLTPTDEMTYNRKPRDDYRPLSRGGAGDEGAKKPSQQVHGISLRRRHKSPKKTKTHFPLGRSHSNTFEQRVITFGDLPRPEPAAISPTATTQPTPPPPRVAQLTPPSRTDTTSAASTVYVVNYHGAPDAPQPVRRREESADQAIKSSDAHPGQDPQAGSSGILKQAGSSSRWQTVPNPFKRKRMTPPAEVRAATDGARKGDLSTPKPPAHSFPRWDVTSRLGAFAAEQGERFRERRQGRSDSDAAEDLPWTIIPAQPRGAAAWSPSMLEKTKSPRGERPHDDSQPSTQLSSATTTAVRDFDGSGAQTKSTEQRDSNGSRQVTWSDTTAASSTHDPDGQPKKNHMQGTNEASTSPQSSLADHADTRDDRSTDRAAAAEAGPSRATEAAPAPAITEPSRPSVDHHDPP